MLYSEPRMHPGSKKGALAVVAAASALALIALLALLFGDNGPTLSARSPGSDGAPSDRRSRVSREAFSSSFEAGGAALPSGRAPDYAPSPADWPGFRGALRDGIAHESTGLSGLEAAPKLLWEVSLGEGHAGAAVADGRVYVLDYLEDSKRDALRCLSLADGEELWRRSYPSPMKRNHGFSRTVPAVAGAYVLSLGPLGRLMCCDRLSGALSWAMDLPAEFGAQIPLWYAGQCPLVDGGVAVVAPGGRTLLAGIDMETGRILWESGNPQAWQMTHSSVMVQEAGGAKLYLYAGSGGVAAVEAPAEADIGALRAEFAAGARKAAAEASDPAPLAAAIRWSSGAWTAQVVAPSPIGFSDGKVFLTAGYGAGSAMFRPEGAGAKLLWSKASDEGLASEQQTPILAGGLLHGVMPKDGGELRGMLVAATADGNIVWTSGKAARFGIGPYLMADGKVYVLDEEGTLTAMKVDAEGCRKLGSFAAVPSGVDAWAPMAMAGTRLLLRDSTRMMCYELAAGGGE